MKRKYVFVIVIVINTFLIIVCGIVFIYFRSADEQNIPVETVVDDNIQKEKNVLGIVDYALGDDELQYITQIGYREVDGTKKECVIVTLESVTAWESLSSERRDEIVKGLINTSRLQIDKAVGCVVIEYYDRVVTEGFWRSVGGYVIIKK